MLTPGTPNPVERPILTVARLNVTYRAGRRCVPAVRDASLSVGAGECVALVGESGSGKSAIARAVVGLAGPDAAVSADCLTFRGVDLLGLDARGWRSVRGRSIGLILQDALASLDPLRPVGHEVDEALRIHGVGRRRRAERVVELLTEVGVPDPELRARQYSHQLSGGLRQRALIASALAAGPDLVIADEPTTALDVTVQAQILELLRRLKQCGTAILLISHDLGVVARVADRVAVLRAGTIVEDGPAGDILERPRHDYTRRLRTAALAVPCRIDRQASGGPILLDVRAVNKQFRQPDGTLRTVALNVSFQVAAGETLGIVGESGSGKTTVARIAMGVLNPESGSVEWDGAPWSGIGESRRRPRRKEIQFVRQDPLSSFNPRFTVQRVVDEAFRALGVRDARDRRHRIVSILERVGLSVEHLERRPAQLSGGQQQRLAIARALAMGPRLLVCDEATSALDAVTRADMLDLLAGLRREHGLALLCISHDLGVIRALCHRVLVMKDGRVVEEGDTETVLHWPQEACTQELVTAAVPAGQARARCPGRYGAGPALEASKQTPQL